MDAPSFCEPDDPRPDPDSDVVEEARPKQCRITVEISIKRELTDRAPIREREEHRREQAEQRDNQTERHACRQGEALHIGFRQIGHQELIGDDDRRDGDDPTGDKAIGDRLIELGGTEEQKVHPNQVDRHEQDECQRVQQSRQFREREEDGEQDRGDGDGRLHHPDERWEDVLVPLLIETVRQVSGDDELLHAEHDLGEDEAIRDDQVERRPFLERGDRQVTRQPLHERDRDDDDEPRPGRDETGKGIRFNA